MKKFFKYERKLTGCRDDSEPLENKFTEWDFCVMFNLELSSNKIDISGKITLLAKYEVKEKS